MHARYHSDKVITILDIQSIVQRDAEVSIGNGNSSGSSSGSTLRIPGRYFIGVVLGSKYKDIHKASGETTGLLEIHLIDSTNQDDPIIFQAWGQLASNWYRYLAVPSAVLVIDSLVMKIRPMDSKWVAQGEIVRTFDDYEDS